MIIFLYILFFVVGIACGLFIYRSQVKNDDGSTQKAQVQIIEDKKVEEIEQEQNAEIPNLTEKLKKNIDNLYIVNELGQKVTSSLNLDQTFNHLYTTINSMMDASIIELSVQDEVSGARKMFTNSEINNTSYTNHMSDWCFKNNREIFLTDAEKDFARYVFQPLV